MSDIAHILGVGPGPSNPNASVASGTQPPPSAPQPSRGMKMQGMSRDVVHILSGGKRSSNASVDSQVGAATAAAFNSMELPPIVPTFTRPSSATPVAMGATPGIKVSGKDVIDKNLVVKVGHKWISKSRPARKWVWAPFSSSSRTDGLLLEHWVRANVEYPDYPYARFDIHLDPVTYTDEEYKALLKSDTWTRSETDFLIDLVRRFELRWPVIFDRWQELYGTQQNQQIPSTKEGKYSRRIEDLQYRYYSVAAKLTQSSLTQEATAEVQTLVAQQAQSMSSNTVASGVGSGVPSNDPSKAMSEALVMETAAARSLASAEPEHQPLVINLGTGTSNKTFDLEYERERRAHLEALWRRTKEEEQEEAEIRRELKQVDAQLRKLKKSGRHILVAAAAAGTPGTGTNASATTSRVSSAASSRNPSRNVSPVPSGLLATESSGLDQAFASAGPTPIPQTPYLQSGRLAPPSAGGGSGLNRTLLARMDSFLDELKVPKRPLPTKRACDLFDSVRKGVLTLLILQKNAIQKEGAVQSRRLKLAKLTSKGKGAQRVMDEDELLGISPPPPAAAGTVEAHGAGSAASASTSVATGGKSKGKVAPRPKSTSAGGGVTGGKGSKLPKASSATPKAPTVAPAAVVVPIADFGPSTGIPLNPTPAAPAVATTAAPAAVPAVAAISVPAAASTLQPEEATAAVPKSAAETKKAPEGGKQPKKKSAKRKRKTEGKSPAAAAAAPGTTGEAASAESGLPATAAEGQSKTGEEKKRSKSKSSGKKKVKKSETASAPVVDTSNAT